MSKEVSRAQLERVIGQLFDQITATQRGLAAVKRAQDSRHTVIEPGSRFEAKDQDGKVTWSLSNDGSGDPVKYVDGPDPSQPEAPEVDVAQGGMVVIVDGYDVHGDLAPADLKHVRVHYSRDSEFEPYVGSYKGQIASAKGQGAFGVSAGLWYVAVQWETKSGKLSEPSEIVTVDVEAPVDQEQIQEVIDETEQRLEDADEAAQQKYQEYDTKHAEHVTAIDDAKTRLTAAEDAFEPIPARIEAAERNVEEARDTATEASAAAIEANNRAMTRLANGNFESGLDYWSHHNVTLTSTAHSGLQAAQVSGWLRPGSSFPVVPDQIWELSLYYQYDVTVVFEAVDGDQRATLSTHHLDGDSSWSDSGALRVTIPADVHMLSFTITGTSAIVDDITLRDVTDVVRLEEAANANRQKAEQAISELAVLQLAVDGEGGLKDRLTTAETVLETKADTSALDQLDQKLRTDLAAFEAHYTRVWRQPTPPPPGTSYEWAGERHASESIKRVDGEEVARNFTHDPEFENDLPEWTAFGADIQVTSSYDQMWGYRGGKMLQVTATSTSSISVRHPNIPIKPGQWFAWRLLAATDREADAAQQIWFYGDSGSTGVKTETYHPAPWYEGTELSYVAQAPDDSNRVSPRVYLRAHELGDRLWLDRVHTVVADTESEALAQVEHHFDGDTPSDRAHDLWYNGDGVPHEWVNGQGWVVLDDQRLAELQDGIDAAMTAAGSKSKVTYSESAPAGTATVGDTHRQQNESGDIVAEWEYTGTGWQKRQVTSGAISNLDVGKLTAGTTEIVEAVINKLWAELGVFGRLEAREGWIGGTLLADGAVTAEKITATRELITKIMGAEWAYISERLVVDGDLIAANIDAISAAIEQLTVTERADFAKAFAEEMWAELGVFDKLQAQEAWITSAMVKELTAEKVTVTQEFVARVASFVEVFADKFWANEAFIGRMAASEAYFGSEDADQQTNVDGTGVTLYRKIDGESIPSAIFGGGDVQLTFFDDNNEPTGAITQDGQMSGQNAQFQSYTLAGHDIFGNPEQYEPGRPLLDNFTQRIPGYGYRNMASLTKNAQDWGFLEVQAQLRAGRSYKVEIPPFLVSADKPYFLRVRYTLDGSSPNWTSTNLFTILSATQTLTGAGIINATEDAQLRLIVFVSANTTGISFPSYGTEVHVLVTDLGPTPEGIGVVRDATRTDHDTQPLVREYSTGWPLGWYQRYRNGTPYGGFANNSLLQGAVSDSEQANTIWGGYTSTAATVGSTTHAELGRTIPQALSGGAQILAGRVRLTGRATGYRNSGWMRLHWHTHQSAPSSFPLSPSPGNYLGGKTVQNGETVYWELPQEVLDAISDGTFGGFSLHARGDTTGYFAATNTDTYRGPILSLDYIR